MLTKDETTIRDALRIVVEAMEQGFEATSGGLSIKRTVPRHTHGILTTVHYPNHTNGVLSMLNRKGPNAPGDIIILDAEVMNNFFNAALADMVAQARTFNLVMHRAGREKEAAATFRMLHTAEALRKVMPVTKVE